MRESPSKVSPKASVPGDFLAALFLGAAFFAAGLFAAGFVDGFFPGVFFFVGTAQCYAQGRDRAFLTRPMREFITLGGMGPARQR